MNTTGFVVLAVVNIPVYFGIGRVFFNDWSDFWEAVRFYLTPDIFSLFRGEYWDDCFGELKLGLWLVCCGACVFGEAYLIENYIL